MIIERGEYEARQAAARAAACSGNFSGLIAWSRGGSTQDHYAEVYYLTGFYTHYPIIPDLPGRWRAQGHTALVLPVDGPSTLILDVARRQAPEPIADRIIWADDVVGALAQGVEETLRGGGDVALVGGEALAWKWGRELAARLPKHRLIEVDELVARIRLTKSAAELDLIRVAGAVGTAAVTAAMSAAIPGVTEAEIAAAAIAELVRSGGSLYGMGLSSGPWAHTFSPSTPAAYSRRRLVAGDMVRLDIYGGVEGYLFDFGRSRVAGKPPTAEQQEILDAIRDSVHAGTELLRPGQTLGAVARRCEDVFAQSAYTRRHGQPRHTMGGAWGHSLGLDWGPPWIVPDSTVEIRPGMYFAVERRIEAPGVGGANYENNIVVTEAGPEVVTPAADRYG
jgi:Xaa-Pro aminopeptidase